MVSSLPMVLLEHVVNVVQNLLVTLFNLVWLLDKVHGVSLLVDVSSLVRHLFRFIVALLVSKLVVAWMGAKDDWSHKSSNGNATKSNAWLAISQIHYSVVSINWINLSRAQSSSNEDSIDLWLSVNSDLFLGCNESVGSHYVICRWNAWSTGKKRFISIEILFVESNGLSRSIDIGRIKPFGEYENVHHSEQQEKHQEHSNCLDHFNSRTSVLSVNHLADNSKLHEHDSQNNGQLHLDSVELLDVVFRQLPDWVHSEWVHAEVAVVVLGLSWVAPGGAVHEEFSIVVEGVGVKELVVQRHWSLSVAGAEQIHWEREELVVQQSSVAGEEAHQGKEVPAFHHSFEAWVSGCFEFVLEHYQDESEHQNDGSVTQVTEHDSEEEWETDGGKGGWVEFLVVRHSILVHNQLGKEEEVVELKVSGRLNFSNVLLVEDGSLEGVHLFSEGWLFVDWAPEVADKGLDSSLHLVHGEVDSLLLGDSPLVDLKHADVIDHSLLSVELVDGHKILLDLTLGDVNEVVSFSKHLSDVSDLVVNLSGGWEFKSLSHEGVTNSLNFVSDLGTFLENDQIDESLLLLNLVSNLMLVVKLLDVSQGLSSGSSEDELLELFLVSSFNTSSNVGNTNNVHISTLQESLFLFLGLDHTSIVLLILDRKLTFLLIISIDQVSFGSRISSVAWRGVSHRWDHSLAILKHLVEVFLNGCVGLQFLQVGGLVKNELLVVLHKSLDLFEHQRAGSVHLGLEEAVALVEGLNVLRSVNLDSVLFALVNQVHESTLSFFTRFDLVGVRQVEWLLSLV